jgi:hypothetical protein
MIPRKTIVESLEESASLVLIRIGPRENYDGFAKIEGGTGFLFILCQFVIFDNIPRKPLCKEVPL